MGEFGGERARFLGAMGGREVPSDQEVALVSPPR